MATIADSVADVKVAQFVRKYKRGMINSLLEYLILAHLAKVPVCGYEIMTLIYDRFHVMLSPGQVYPVIDYLARDGIIQKNMQGRRVLLRLTSLGESLLKTWKEEQISLQFQLDNLRVQIENSS